MLTGGGYYKMTSPLTKGVVILLCINIFLFFGAGIRVIETNNEGFMEKFIDIDQYKETGEVVESSDLNTSISSNFQKSGTGILSFIDALGAVKSFVTFIVNIVFTPFGLFRAASLPSSVGLIVGVPLVGMLVMSIAYFIRSGN